MNTELVPALKSIALLGAFIRPLLVIWLLSGLWLGLARAALPSYRRMIVWGTTAASLIAWLAVVWTLALHGAFAPGTSAAPRPGLGLIVGADLLLVVTALTLLVRSKSISAASTGPRPSVRLRFSPTRSRSCRRSGFRSLSSSTAYRSGSCTAKDVRRQSRKGLSRNRHEMTAVSVAPSRAGAIARQRPCAMPSPPPTRPLRPPLGSAAMLSVASLSARAHLHVHSLHGVHLTHHLLHHHLHHVQPILQPALLLGWRCALTAAA